jgi:hypothetical protein
MKGPGFDLFNTLSGTIDVKLSEAPERIGQLLNLKTTPSTKVLDVKWHPEIYTADDENSNDNLFRPLTSEDLDLVVFDTSELYVNSHACMHPGRMIKHEAPNGENFTVRDMIEVVAETERQTRGETEWFGGPDVHHIFFEGITESKDLYEGQPIWTLQWGS